MTKKGKKKKKQTTAASTSKETLQEQTSQEQTSQGQSSQQQEEQSSEALASSTQQKITIAKEQEVAASTSKQTADGSSKQQKKLLPQGQQQQESLGTRQVSQDHSQQQQQQRGGRPRQQISQSEPQPLQGAWSRPRQQTPQNLPQQQPQEASSQQQQQSQGARSQPQQQGARSQPQQQGARSQPQQQGARSQPQQQGARSQPQQQGARSQPQQQGARSQPQQQGARSQPQQQGARSQPQQQGARSQPQQQGARSQPQQQGARSQPQQQGARSQPQQQGARSQPQQQGARSQPQQQGARSQPQQQGARSQPQQQGARSQPQQQGARSQPQQQGARSQPQQQGARSQPQQQGARSQPQQQGARSQPQQQGARSQPQQQGARSQPQQQGARSQPQQQGARSQPQQQGARSQPQQQGARSQPQQQGARSQPQQQGARSQPQQQGARSQPQQQGARSQPQQQGARSQPQQQGARSQPQQQGARSQPQQQGARSQPQQQGARSQPQQQGARSQPQQQGARSQPQQQGARSQPQQQGARSQPQQQGARSQPQQQGARSQPQQQPQETRGQQQQSQEAWSQPQQQGAWGRPRQQIPQSEPQQLQGASSQQQQQSQGAWSRLPQQQQPQGAWGPQQTAWEQQQHRAPTLPQQQQKASIGTGAAGDHRQVQTSGVHREQPSTSTLDVSKLALTDPFHKEKTEKAKMSSEQLKVYHNMIPKRKNPLCGGTIGDNISVFTNMFQIIFSDKFVTNAVHYDINIRPLDEKPKKTETKKETRLPKILCRNIFEQCRNKHFSERFPAYDGNKNAYSANELPFPNEKEDVFWFENEKNQKKQYKINLRKVAHIDLSWIKNLRPGLAENKDRTALQVLDIIMRHAPESRFTNVGRSLYWDVEDKLNKIDKIDESELLGDGLFLVHGGFLSGVLGWKPYLNVDVAHKGFTMNQRVLQYITELTKIGEEKLSHSDIIKNKDKILGFLKGLKVTYEIPNISKSKRTYRVLDLWPDSCNSHTFISSDVSYSITTYFRVIKGYSIRKPDLPTLHVGKTSNGDKILVPLELCSIVGGQAFNKKLNETQTRNMIRVAATSASQRKQNIEAAFKKLEINRSPVMKKEFNVSVSTEMQKVDARVLPPPTLKYAKDSTLVKKGVWNLHEFNQAKHLGFNSWTILNLTGITDPQIWEFVKKLQDTARTFGMTINNPESPFKTINKQNTNGITTYFNHQKHLQLIMVIIPDFTDPIYGCVKKISEMDVGVLTQCIKKKNVEMRNKYNATATITNLLQKINSKLNGINHILDNMPSCLRNCSCMLVGADVTHPAPDSKNVPSIAAVAASRNNSAFQYSVTLRLQPPKEEMILDLEAIILSQLNIYYQGTKISPQRLIYYRDGVSEGQLPQVMFYEINAIKNAIKAFNKGNIEVTCMIVQKRHHVRLFPTNKYQTDDRNCNVRAGTIVDKTITHPDHIDFYLVSHASIQGTARPTKYRCICNDSQFNEDQLEEMTYFLCHMYARCTRSVSYPAPTYYAHLAAFRGRILLQTKSNINLADLEREQRDFQIKMAASPMYFV
ncbi:PREDICTED: protein argonaute-3-like [Trachymyrmex septentrionalis]|uniref:protein argonaute-3-like n=1 Tax=Trachymyrmex septentrionalis TaxID=34720 RepID=UPI00084F2E8B|nr:PREDICTED: protein argonaute-3-like [Trachymyrmex septentrionalis]